MSGPIESEYEGIVGIKNTSPEFRAKLAEVARRIGAEPRDLACVISFETGGSFRADQRNLARGSAIGLIQFMPETCRRLGVTPAEMARMSAVEQLDYVERYMKSVSRGRPLDNPRDLYMAVVWPDAVGRGDDDRILDRTKRQYRDNSGLDINGDGKITAREATEKMLDRALEPWARQRGREAPPPEVKHDDDGSWRRDLAYIGMKFALEYGFNRRNGNDPDAVATGERVWRAFEAIAATPDIRAKLHEMTSLDGPELVRVVRHVVEYARGVDGQEPKAPLAPARAPQVEQRREPTLVP